MTGGKGSISSLSEEYSQRIAVAMTRANLRGKGIGKVRAWNGVDGSLKSLSDSAASDLEIVL